MVESVVFLKVRGLDTPRHPRGASKAPPRRLLETPRRKMAMVCLGVEAQASGFPCTWTGWRSFLLCFQMSVHRQATFKFFSADPGAQISPGRPSVRRDIQHLGRQVVVWNFCSPPRIAYWSYLPSVRHRSPLHVVFGWECSTPTVLHLWDK